MFVTVPNPRARMPVTIKLSRKFYEKLGEDLANELVDWFNKVDATYRGDLREVNELNFARFDAKLEQRLVELDAKWGSKWSALDAKLEQRLVELDAKWGSKWSALDAKLEQRLVELDAKWGSKWSALDAKLEQRVAQLHADLQTGLATLKGELLAEIGKLRGETTAAIARAQSTTVKWMFRFWAPTAAGIVATAVGVAALLLHR